MVSKYWTDIKNDLPEAYYESVEYADVGKMPISVNGVRLRRSSRLPSPPIPVSTVSAFQAWNSLIEEEDIGANRRLSCDGGWVDMLDGVDKRVLREARNGTGRSHHTGQIASHTEVGGFPDLDTGVPCNDADRDGMPDKFEARYGLDADDPVDAMQDPDGDGYTNLEEFLNGSVPR